MHKQTHKHIYANACIYVHSLGRKELLPPLLCSCCLEVNLHPDRVSEEEVWTGGGCCKASWTVSANGSHLHAKMSSLIASSQVPKKANSS